MDSDVRLQRRKKFIIDTAFWAVILAIAYFVFKYLINLVMPLFLAFVLAAAARPFAKFMSRETKDVTLADGSIGQVARFHIPYNLAAVLGVGLVFLIIVGFLALIIVPLTKYLVDSIAGVPVLYERTILPALQRLMQEATDFPDRLPLRWQEAFTSLLDKAIPNLISTISSAVTSLSGKVVGLVSSIATSLPSFLLKSLICVIATIFISLDFDLMRSFVYLNLHTGLLDVVVEVRDSLVDIVWKFIRSYFLIFLITTAEITAGLYLIGVKNPVLIAVMIAIFDAFPIVGSGMILLPWAVTTIIIGGTWKGVGLFALYLVVVVVRQVVEPKIVGRHVGLRPIVSLGTMYIGQRLFGAIGLFGLPITVAIIADLNDKFHLFTSPNAASPALLAEDEEPEAEAAEETEAEETAEVVPETTI